MKNVLIDSDVILDFFLDRDPFVNDTSILLSMCEMKQINGFVTPIIISNVFYILSKTNKRESVIDSLKILISFIDVINVNKEIVIQSLNSNFNDFEDALQNYAAEYSNNISTIITRNKKDYKNSKLNVVTPTEYLKVN